MRIQVLHLPAPPDEYPFALVIDEADEHMANWATDELAGRLSAKVGAKAVLVFPGTVEVL